MEKIKYKPLYIRLEERQYRQWRDLAHVNEMSMAEMIRALVDNKLSETKKRLTSRDIAI